MLDHERGSILVAIDALTRALAFDNAEQGVALAQTQLASVFGPPRDEQRIVVADSEAVTMVVRYVPTVDGVDDPDVARALWRDAMTSEADALAERHGADVELHYEDMLEPTYPDQFGADRVNESGPGNES